MRTETGVNEDVNVNEKKSFKSEKKENRKNKVQDPLLYNHAHNATCP